MLSIKTFSLEHFQPNFDVAGLLPSAHKTTTSVKVVTVEVEPTVPGHVCVQAGGSSNQTRFPLCEILVARCRAKWHHESLDSVING